MAVRHIGSRFRVRGAALVRLWRAVPAICPARALVGLFWWVPSGHMFTNVVGGDVGDERVFAGRPTFPAICRVYSPRGVVVPVESSDGAVRTVLGSKAQMAA